MCNSDQKNFKLKQILSPNCAARAISHLPIKPVTLSDDHSLVKPHFITNQYIQEVLQDSEFDNVDIDSNPDSNTKMSRIKATIKDYIPDQSYFPIIWKLMVHMMITPLFLCHGEEPETITSQCNYNRNRPATEGSTLDRFTLPQEA